MDLQQFGLNKKDKLFNDNSKTLGNNGNNNSAN